MELTRSAQPPWPLAIVQPGLVLSEAALFKLTPHWPPERRQWLVLVVPLACFLASAIALALAVSLLVARHAPELGLAWRWLAALSVGLAFLLDPEAQHAATGGFTELPFTLGLVGAVAFLARGAPWRPFLYGLGLGVTGLFRGNMLWLAPILAACFAWAVPARRPRAFVRCLLGYAVVLAPWWLYKWRAFGTPAWDLSALSLWDGVEGRTWFSLNHLPALPAVPGGLHAARALAAKMGSNLASLLLQISTGPRTLWIASLAVAAAGFGRPTSAPDAGSSGTPPLPQGRPVTATAAAALAVLAASLLATAATVPLLRYLLPARLVAEAAGLVAVWAMLWRLPAEWMSRLTRVALCATMAVLAMGWGVWQTSRGIHEAQFVARDRGLPRDPTMLGFAAALDRELPPGEPVMSNLGPSLAWFARRPVIHLALSPADMDACRRRVDFTHALVVFRGPERAWSGWTELMEAPARAPDNKEWNIASARVTQTGDGFVAVWLRLGPLGTPLADGGSAAGQAGAAGRGVARPAGGAGRTVGAEPSTRRGLGGPGHHGRLVVSRSLEPGSATKSGEPGD